MKKLIIIAAALAIALPCQAARIKRYNESVRALGMGGAFTAVADDENALFYNPAGLSRIDEWSMGVINPMVEVNAHMQDFYDDFKDVDTDNTQEVTDLLRKHLGDTAHARFTLFPYFAAQNFAVGVLARGDLNVTPHNAANPEAEIDSDASVGLHVGYGREYKGFSGGVGVKYIQGQSLERTYEAADIASDDFGDMVEDDMESDSGLGVDLGAMYKFDTFLEPRVALAVINAVEPGINDSDFYKRQINLGFSATYNWADFVSLTGAVDLVDVATNLGDDDDYAKRLYMGLEAKLPMILSLRCGLHQGYFTVGATADLWVLKLSYAHYYEEMGAKVGDHADERHVAQLSLGW